MSWFELFIQQTINGITRGSIFALIALVFNLAVLEVWRWPFALNNSMRKRGA